MGFQGNGWSVSLITLGDEDTWIRAPHGSYVRDDYHQRVTYYYVHENGSVYKVFNKSDLENLARERNGELFVSRENPRRFPMLYEKLKPACLKEEQNQERLGPLQSQITDFKADVVNQLEALNKRTANVEGLHKVLIRELRAISEATQAQTQCMKEMMGTCKKILERPPPPITVSPSAKGLSSSTSVQHLADKIETVRKENTELRKILGKHTQMLEDMWDNII